MENPITEMRIEGLQSHLNALIDTVEKLKTLADTYKELLDIQQEEIDLLTDRIQFLETLHETNDDEGLDEDDELLDWAERGLVENDD